MDDETRYIIGRTVSIRTAESEASIEEVMRQAKGHLDRQSYSISTRFNSARQQKDAQSEARSPGQGD